VRFARARGSLHERQPPSYGGRDSPDLGRIQAGHCRCAHGRSLEGTPIDALGAQGCVSGSLLYVLVGLFCIC
jgi:hypothetical protein